MRFWVEMKDGLGEQVGISPFRKDQIFLRDTDEYSIKRHVLIALFYRIVYQSTYPSQVQRSNRNLVLLFSSEFS